MKEFIEQKHIAIEKKTVIRIKMKKAKKVCHKKKS